MKKKLNLLWNLKFNFFSVAERPLTFFAYFLNAKKVGRRRLVIVPATAGGLPLFPHAASAFTPALAPVRSHFACGETGLAGRCPPLGATCSLPHFRFARMWPCARTPALVAVRLHFASGETARPVVAPAGGNVLATPFSLRSNVAPRSHPGAACPVYRTENALFCSCRVFQYLTMQVKAPFY